MRTLILSNGKVLKLYDSIDEMPIVNFQKYNKLILLDSGLGSDIDSVDEHIIKVAKYIESGNSKEAIQELQNMRQNMHLIVSNISPKYMAFAALIHSIDGNVVNDLSDDNLKAILSKLDVKHSVLSHLLDTIKDKITSELKTYFVNEFGGGDAKENKLYSLFKKKVLLQLSEVYSGDDKTQEISLLDYEMLMLFTPKEFIGPHSVEIKYDKQFETACMLISQKTGMNAKSMTILEFYNTLSNLEKQAKLEASHLKKK